MEAAKLLSKMTVAELKAELASRDLPVAVRICVLDILLPPCPDRLITGAESGAAGKAARGY